MAKQKLDDAAGLGLVTAWLRALPLEERLNVDVGSRVTKMGERLLARWKEQHPFDDNAMFAQLMRLYNTDEKSLLNALSLPYTCPPPSPPPDNCG